MTFPKRGTRSISVMGQEYLWHLDPEIENRTSWIVIQHKQCKGQLLCLDPYHPDIHIGPGIVARAITFALENGWNPSANSPPLRLASDGTKFFFIPGSNPKLYGQFDGAVLRSIRAGQRNNLELTIEVPRDRTRDAFTGVISLEWIGGISRYAMEEYLADLKYEQEEDKTKMILTRFDYVRNIEPMPGRVSLSIGINNIDPIQVHCMGLTIMAKG